MAPASFEPGSPIPRVVAKDGTIYAQATPVPAAGGADQAVELHYFHLWSRDCGRGGHRFDVEHVSALVERRGSEWTATLWYAAAHEDTVCDASSGAQAAAVRAERAGPQVYISRGKHASYFNPGQCKWGCGSDECGRGRRLDVTDIINIGERGAPLNGAEWIDWRHWPLPRKLGSDFDPHVRASLDQSSSTRVISLMLHLRAPQAPVLAGDTAIDALDIARGAAGSAIGTAGKSVIRFLRRGVKWSERSSSPPSP